MQNLPRSAMAVTSLVLGIIALVTSVLPIVNNLSFLMGILGIIFAAVGLVGITKGKKSGKGLALAGLILSVLACALTLVMQSAFSAAFDQVMDESESTLMTQQDEGAGEMSGSGAEANETQAAQPAPAAMADYSVTIDGCRVTEDYQGNPVAVVTYTFTNNGDDATSFMVACRAQAFQNGVELDSAIGSEWDSDKWMSDVKTGGTTTVEIGYELEDMSDVTVEVSETFSWDDVLLAEQTFSLA